MDNIVEFKCNIDRVVFSSGDFSIYGATVDKADEPKVKLNKYNNVTLVGNGLDLTSGVDYIIEAKEKNDKKFGIQYQVIAPKRAQPRSYEECSKFLQEIITHNQAKELLKHYPDIVNKIINDDLDDIDLQKTHGIKEKTFQTIKDKVMNNFGLIDILNKFGSFGISISMLKKIYDKFGKVSQVEVALRNDPYQALCSINGIGFKKADAIIRAIPPKLLGIRGNILESRQRMMACMIYLLNENENEGNTKMCANKFREQCLEMTPECINHFVTIIKEESDIIYFCKDDKVVAKTSAYDTELYIANKIKEIQSNGDDWNLPYEQYKFDEDSGFELTDMQLQTLKNVNEHKVSMLSGAGGSGKSFSISSLIRMLEDNGKSYELSAPTGKSANVLSKYTQREASTIHRLLGYGINEDGVRGFMYDKNNQFKVDLILVDEFSMVDIRLGKSLLEAIDPNRTKLLFIQDPSQIPSVSSGNICADMLDSKTTPTTTLDKIFRYAEGGLFNVATKVRKGEQFLPKDRTSSVTRFGDNEDYSFIDTGRNSAEDVANLYMSIYNKGEYGVEDITVMSHHNKGDYGTRAINKIIQSKANPLVGGKKYVKSGNTNYIIGDRVMQLSNNYNASVFVDGGRDSNMDGSNNNAKTTSIYNGNTGIIVNILDGNIIVDFGNDLFIQYKQKDLDQLDLAYAVNIYKMQGSSSKVTIILTPSAHTYFMNRNLLYTAITRTEEICYHFATAKLINIALKRSVNRDRMTFLEDMLLNEVGCDE